MHPEIPANPYSWRRLLLIGLCLAAIGGSGFYLWRHLRAGGQLQEARSLAARDDLSAARTKLLEGLQLRPDNPDLHFELGRVSRRLGLEKEAREHWRRCEELGGVPELLRLERLLLKVQQGDLDASEKEMWAYIEKGVPDKDLFLEALARGYLVTFRLGQAQHCLDLLLRDRPDHRLALDMQGRLNVRMRNNEAARKTYEKLVEVAPDDLPARLALGRCLNELNLPHLAQVHFDHVLKLHPDDVEAAHGLARALAVQGKMKEAQATLQTLDDRRALRPEGVFLRGKVELDLNGPQAALPFLRRAAEAAPFDREPVYTLALCLRRLNQEDEAKKWFSRSDDIDARQKRLGELTKEIMKQPKNPDLRCEAGEIFLDTRQNAEGLSWLFSALQEDPTHVPTHRRLSTYFRSIGRLDLADYHARQAASRGP